MSLDGKIHANDQVAHGQRLVKTGDVLCPRRVDVRLHPYDANPLLIEAQIYQDQATKFHTPGRWVRTDADRVTGPFWLWFDRGAAEFRDAAFATNSSWLTR
jgi:hypothetical protein